MTSSAMGARQIVQSGVIKRAVKAQHRDVLVHALLLKPMHRCRLGASVVDQHQFVGNRPGALTDRFHTGLGELYLVAEGNQDGHKGLPWGDPLHPQASQPGGMGMDASSWGEKGLASVSHKRQEFVALVLAEGKAIARTRHIWNRWIVLLAATDQDLVKMLDGGLLVDELQAEIQQQVVEAATV